MGPDRISRTSLMEHLALECDLDLRGFCERFQKALRLPDFGFDHENATEWGSVEVDYVEYNISRPYKPGTLQDWDDTVPPGCNFGISLILYREHPYTSSHEWAYAHLVLPVGQKIADEFQVPVYYHRTWLGVGKNVKRDLTFHPAKV